MDTDKLLSVGNGEFRSMSGHKQIEPVPAEAEKITQTESVGA